MAPKEKYSDAVLRGIYEGSTIQKKFDAATDAHKLTTKRMCAHLNSMGGVLYNSLDYGIYNGMLLNAIRTNLKTPQRRAETLTLHILTRISPNKTDTALQDHINFAKTKENIKTEIIEFVKPVATHIHAVGEEVFSPNNRLNKIAKYMKPSKKKIEGKQIVTPIVERVKSDLNAMLSKHGVKKQIQAGKTGVANLITFRDSLIGQLPNLIETQSYGVGMHQDAPTTVVDINTPAQPGSAAKLAIWITQDPKKGAHEIRLITKHPISNSVPIRLKGKVTPEKVVQHICAAASAAGMFNNG